MKRKRSDSSSEACTQNSVKRIRKNKLTLLEFTDEIILRILSHLEAYDLNLVERLSKRLQRLSIDGTLWKAKYHARWLAPRLQRAFESRRKFDILNTRQPRQPYDLHPWQQCACVDWKRLYRIRSNWRCGRCRRRHMRLDQLITSANVHTALQRGIIFTADRESGLRAWSRNSTFRPLHAFTLSVDNNARSPTSLAIDEQSLSPTILAVGFTDGSFRTLSYSPIAGFLELSSWDGSMDAITSIALLGRCVLTMSDDKRLALYQQSDSASHSSSLSYLQLATLSAEVSIAPLSVCLRKVGDLLVAGLAYAMPHIGLGWCIGLQELHLKLPNSSQDMSSYTRVEGESTRTRIVAETRLAFSQPFALHPKILQRPSGLSYKHPYLVATLSDNTLISHLVVSTADRLGIMPGRRLWGHTSAISGVQVDSRGKAVTVSIKGDDLRLWELEELGDSQSRTSVRVQAAPDLNLLTSAMARRGNALGRAVRSAEDEAASRSYWIGFDAEQVVVAAECRNSRQPVLTCYDFDYTN